MSYDPHAIKQTFDEVGFVTLRQFIAGDHLTRLKEHLARYLDEVVPSLPAEHVFYEDKRDASSLKQLQQMGDYDSYFEHLAAAGAFRSLVELLLDGPVRPQNLQYFNKPAGVGQGTPPHQDGYYFMLSPCEAATMWLALDRVDDENGCVRYIPGSHRGAMRPHGRTNTLGFSQGITHYDEQDREAEVAVHAEPGDLLVHHARTIHRADGNRSADRSRRALGFVYFSERAVEDQAAKAAYQRQLTAELTAAGKL